MKTEPIVPARITFTDGQPPSAADFGDVYHPEAGALGQARHVFLGGNGLPQRWADRRRFVIVETGFGLGNNFLAAWDAWRHDPQRCAQLVFVSIERHPPTRADLQRSHACSELQALADQLVDAWPVVTPNLHPIEFEGGRVRLLLGFGDVAALLPQLQLQADALMLDGFAPRCNPAMWDARVVKGLARLCAPGATAATWSVARALHAALAASGFDVGTARGFDRKREMTVATYRPAFVPRRSPVRHAAADGPRDAVVIGAGLAGALAAAALARQGWRCTVLDRHAGPAAGASGNPGGLFHATAHVGDGVHARFTRAAALWAARCHARAIADGDAEGQVQGLLRLHPAPDDGSLPADVVRRVDGDELAALAGQPLDGPAALFGAGGWVAPGDIVRRALRQPGVVFQGDAAVSSIERIDGLWRALGADGRVLAAAPVLVLAGGAGDSLLAPVSDAVGWPLAAVRGQVTWFESSQRLLRPLSGEGYALTLPDGRLLCGATTGHDDDPQVRDADHRFNLERLAALAAIVPPPQAALHGRVGWRSVCADRLPLVGAVPQRQADIAAGTRLDHARGVPRIEGLYVLGGLASRGLTWAPLAAEVLAAWIDGAPLPLEADLVDAIDPARWVVRSARRPG